MLVALIEAILTAFVFFGGLFVLYAAAYAAACAIQIILERKP